MEVFINDKDNEKVVDTLIKFRSNGIIPFYGFSIFCTKLLFLKHLYASAESYKIDPNELIIDNKINQNIIFKLMEKIKYPNVDINLLKIFVPEIINFVNRDDKIELIEFIKNDYEFDYIEVIEKIIEKRGNDKTQIECYLTNKYLFSYVIYLMKKSKENSYIPSLDVKDIYLDKIYLPFLGINLHLFTNKKDDYLYNVDFYGGDIDRSVIAMMQMLYMLRNETKNITINEQDSFIDNSTKNDKYSYIFCDTPFTNLKDIDNKYMKNKDQLINYLYQNGIVLSTKNNEILAIENVLNKLDNNSFAVISVTDKFLSSDTYAMYRKYLLNKRNDIMNQVYLDAVIQLGCVTYEFKGNTNFLVLRKNPSFFYNDKIKFIDLSDIKFDNEEDLKQAISKTNEGKYYTYDELLYNNPKYNLNLKNLYEDEENYEDQQDINTFRSSNNIKEDINKEIINLENLLNDFKNM